MRVLVADDQILLLLDLTDQLARHGMETVAASNAAEALARLDHTIDALVTDIDMPGMSGIDLAWQVSRTYPHLPIVVASGGRPPRAGDLPPHAVFLAKPLRIGDVLAALCGSSHRHAA